ncbi:MAG: hypothetical protein J6X19_00890, partial [Clostridia bacterium]|nr:hypothetical protein [Clostridia bacterium]
DVPAERQRAVAREGVGRSGVDGHAAERKGGAERDGRAARLRLTACTATCIKTALRLIGVNVVEKM